ncbi:MAG: hypothetical protein KJ958_10570 [Gammaproteobacteria bacterium]|nr:hypothetical protein [Gammaproteobacteria bacterium]MBU1979598.1 hypothetical protein [Gammaproteobacteria bacterium]
MSEPEKVGLLEGVRTSATCLLHELFPLWIAEQPADWKRVVRPQGGGSFSINIEPYRGIHTWIAFQRRVEELASLKDFQVEVMESQPELLGYVSVPGRSQKIQDVTSLATCWCKEAERHLATGVPMNDAIGKVLDDLHAVLISRRVKQQVRTPLSGLTLPEGVEWIELTDRFSVRKLSDEEISDLGSHDVTSGDRHDIISRSVSTAAFIEEDVLFRLTPDYSEPIAQSDLQQRNQEQLGTLLSALHVLKEGRVGVIASFFDIGPLVLPGLGGHSMAPLVRHPFASMNLTSEDIPRLFEVHSRLTANQRDEVRIACVRLMDAEHRMSPVDALLDAVIGLEALLNPNDSSELSFRVALNYAFLGTTEVRRVRFERIRDIQKVRNRVVHGGLNLQSKDAPLIHEQAIIAKACLRDSIQSFLFDTSLSGNRKLDADFWLNRVLPSAVLALQTASDLSE